MKRELKPESRRKNVSPEQNLAYAQSLKRLIDCKTVWEKDGRNAAEFERFYGIMEELFPLLHEKAERRVFGSGCFFFKITGKCAKQNILLMSHHDVVEATEGWLTDAFTAELKDGCLFGRGAVDTKTPLFAELQAAEELLQEGYDFEGINLYIGSSNNEEVSGDGMLLAAEHFRQQGIRFDVILDEGGAITSGMLPGVSAKSAVIAVHEKGRHLYKCSIKESTPGHGGLNPVKGSPAQTMAEFVAQVGNSNIFKPAFAPEVKATFQRHAPYMSFPLNLIFGAFGLFSPIIKKIMMGIPQASAMLSTGLCFTAMQAGDCELPHIKGKEAEMYFMLRCVREELLERELQELKRIAKKHGVDIELINRDYCIPTNFNTRHFEVLESLLHENFPDVITAPFLLTAGTDARRFSDIADSILRFAPIDLSREQFATVHGDNENITIENIGQCVLFYKDFIKAI